MGESDRQDRFTAPIAYRGVERGAPTPLDAYRVYVGTDEDHVNYIHDAQSRTSRRIHEAGAAIGLPEPYQQLADRELDAALDVRVARNSASYERLLSKISGGSVDGALYEIIQKARAGGASASELLRLVKENPEMISVEFFKRQPLFDTEEYSRSVADLDATLRQVQAEFQDAEITLLSKPVMTAEPFATEHGAIVWKEKIGDCKTYDSHSEIITKHTMLALPPTVQLRGVKYNHIKINGQTLNLLPMGISAYFRAADYKERAGYASPEGEVRHELTPEFLQSLGRHAERHAEILQGIPRDMWDAYLSAATTLDSSES